MLTREQLLDSFERRYRDVPTIVGMVRIRNLTEDEKASFEQDAITDEGKINRKHHRSQRRKLIALCLVDADGKLLLTQKGDVDRLRAIDSAVASEIMDACAEHVGFNKAERDAFKKNSDETDDIDSLTDSLSAGES